EEDVPEPAVEESVGDELPGRESRSRRPEREQGLERVPGLGLEQEYDDVGDQQRLRDGRHGRSLRPASPLGDARMPGGQSEYLTTMRATRVFSGLQLAKAWQTCFAPSSARSENFSAKRAWPASWPGWTRASVQGCLSSPRM